MKFLKKKLPLIIGIILLVIGVGLIAYQPIMNYIVTPKVLESSYEKTFKEINNKRIKDNLENAKKASDKDFDFNNIELLSGDITKINPNIDKSKIVGEIYIPKVKLHLPITYGTTNENLLYSATTMKKNQKMGDGNYSLAGHNAVNRSVLFAPLHDVKTHDYVYVTNKKDVYKYLVDDILVVKPSEVNVIDDVGDKKMITLVTCEDFAGTKRLIVQGTLVDTFPYEKKMALEKSMK